MRCRRGSSKLESALNAPRPVATDPNVLGRLGSMEGLIKPLSDSIIALARRADDTDAAFRNVRGRIDTTAATVSELQNAARASSGDHGEIVKLADRIAALEKVDRTVADQLAKNAAASAAAAVNDRPIRFALAASALRAAFERGEPFTAELAAVKPLTANMQTLAAIEPFAASGVPSAATLGRELLDRAADHAAGCGHHAARRRIARSPAGQCREAGAHPPDRGDARR